MSQTPSGLNPQDKRTPQSDSVDPLMPPPPPPTTEPVPTAQPLAPAKEQAVPIDTASRAPTVGQGPVPPQPTRPIRVSRSAVPTTPLSINAAGESAEEDEDFDVVGKAQRAAPPWVVSLAVHTMILVILGYLFIPDLFDNQVKLKIFYAEKLGEQIEDDAFESPEWEKPEAIEPLLVMEEMEVDDPFAAPPIAEKIADPINATSEVEAPSIGMALKGREKGMKTVRLAAYGGNATTEEAVIRGLEWLKRNQLRNGSWSLVEPYRGGGAQENLVGATAMALLAFQGHGSTHESGPYRKQVADGWDFLLKQQDGNGSFAQGNLPPQHTLYSQALASIGICELYGMTENSLYSGPAQKAINYAVKYQDEQGGWRYIPGNESDTSVTGWFVMLMHSGRMAKLDVPQETLDRIEDYLDRCAIDGGSRYTYRSNTEGYRPGTVPKISMTAVALLSRQYLGWKHDDLRLNRGAQILSHHPINYDEPDVYYWYYATQVMHQMGGDYWRDWNRVMRQVLPEKQVKDGEERGSWSPAGDPYGQHGGRLYTTCFSIYMLEVYYRYLPIYKYLK